MKMNKKKDYLHIRFYGYNKHKHLKHYAMHCEVDHPLNFQILIINILCKKKF